MINLKYAKDKMKNYDYNHVFSKSLEFSEKNDCAVIALSIATNTPYKKVHKLFSEHGRKKNQGVSKSLIHKVLDELGYTVYKEYRMKNPTIKRLNELVQKYGETDEIYLFYTRNHVFTAKNGAVQDWTTDRRFIVKWGELIVKKDSVGKGD